MDPNANLREVLSLAREIIAIWDERGNAHGELAPDDALEAARLADCLADRVLDLDEHITRGGALPRTWRAST